MLKELVKEMQTKKASSMHMSAGMPPLFNVNGRLHFTSSKKLEADEINRIVQALMNDVQEKKFKRDSSVNFTYLLEDTGRLRITLFKQKGLISAVFRLLASRVPTIKELNLPPIINRVTDLRSGLVIVGGPSGSGKSSTIAAILDVINKSRRTHIVTLEDPIEFGFVPDKSLFSQREIGIDSRSFPRALRGATRQDADVIMIGEMRDLETISIALTAAETGILVFGTMTTTDCVQTITRIIGAFPSSSQHQICTQIAIVLKAVVCQQLVMRVDGLERVPAAEIMFSTQAIQSLIREKKMHQIYSAIETGGDFGMQTLDQALQKLHKDNVISDLEVVTKAVQPEFLRKKLFGTTDDSSLPGEDKGPGFVDVGEEMISIEKKMLRYRANFSPGQEGFWTSSIAVCFKDPGMVLSIPPGTPVQRIYVSDFNVVGKRISPFELPYRLLVRFKLEANIDEIPVEPPELLIKIFTQPEKGKISSYNKINLSFPLTIDEKWHTWVINIPEPEVGKLMKITMVEFPVILTKIMISDIIFF